ncbi:unnamed protein product [Owenia fusiformis]|uniref:Transglutaminase-like domain-containing protein n=1 Tax=Owenia fusiformis TaxID=6347 RepID=A0A8S4NLS5_OWEFU|nr:unnamed protein product [Owenia fusiformis]
MNTATGKIVTNTNDNEKQLTKGDLSLKLSESHGVTNKSSSDSRSDREENMRSMNTATGKIDINTNDNEKQLTKGDLSLKLSESHGVTNKSSSDSRSDREENMRSMNTATGKIVINTNDNEKQLTNEDLSLKLSESHGVTNKSSGDSRSDYEENTRSMNTATGKIVINTNDNEKQLTNEDLSLKLSESHGVTNKSSSDSRSDREENTRSMNTATGKIVINTNDNEKQLTNEDLSLKLSESHGVNDKSSSDSKSDCEEHTNSVNTVTSKIVINTNGNEKQQTDSPLLQKLSESHGVTNTSSGDSRSDREENTRSMNTATGTIVINTNDNEKQLTNEDLSLKLSKSHGVIDKSSSNSRSEENTRSMNTATGKIVINTNDNEKQLTNEDLSLKLSESHGVNDKVVHNQHIKGPQAPTGIEDFSIQRKQTKEPSITVSNLKSSCDSKSDREENTRSMNTITGKIVISTNGNEKQRTDGPPLPKLSETHGVTKVNISERKQIDQALVDFQKFSMREKQNTSLNKPAPKRKPYVRVACVQEDDEPVLEKKERIQGMQAPPEFQAIPINEQLNEPPPKPNTTSQINVNRGENLKVFDEVDEQAYEVAQKEYDSFNDLIFNLIHASNITNELDKVRAIFLWLCTKDLKNMEFKNVQPDSPEEVLLGLKRGNVTYSVIFKTLCSYAGIHCKTLSGLAKGVGFEPGMTFTDESENHTWNAVFIDGQWYLADCNWAARKVHGRQETLDNLKYELDEFYFLPDPKQFIFTHFPKENDWQLLECPLLQDEFENLPVVKSTFFKLDLQLNSHKEAVIWSTGEVEITLACPTKANKIGFVFGLTFEDDREEYKGRKLTQYGMHERIDNLSIFRVRTPEKGSYKFTIYAKKIKSHTKVEKSYGAVCEYQIVCDRDTSSIQPYPGEETIFGPSVEAKRYKIKAPSKGACISLPNGHTEIKFKMPKVKELHFMAKLKSNAMDETSLQQYVMTRVVNNFAVFSVNLPHQGEYALEIFASDSATDGTSHYLVWRYLLECNQPIVKAVPFPKMSLGYLGKPSSGEELVLTTYSHHDPYIKDAVGEVIIQMKTTRPLRVTSELIHTTNDEDFTDFILQQYEDNIISFVVKLPKAGSYKLQMYALPNTEPSETLPGVYNYLIDCSQAHASLVAYPKQYGHWKECYLFEPTHGHLDPSKPTRGSTNSQQFIFFKIEVPNVSAVAVVVGTDHWTQLDQKQPNVWEGQVTMNWHWGVENRVDVCARRDPSNTSYSTLLTYTM